MDGTASSWRDSPLVLVDNTTSLDDLCSFEPSLMVDILCRLPVKTVVGSTAVNKSWYALIKSPSFISAHIKRSISILNKINTDYLFIVSNSKCSAVKFNPANPHLDFREKEFQIPFRTNTNTIGFVGGVNGLFCFTDDLPNYYGRHLYLWNPSVRTYKTVISTCFPRLMKELLGCYPVVGFGFDEQTSDYKVVRIAFRADADGYPYGKLAPVVEVFSLRRNTWRNLKNVKLPRLANNDLWAYVSGTIYWMDMDNRNPKSLWILSFDVHDEVFGEVRCPVMLKDGFGGGDVIVNVMDFQGSLSLCATCLSLVSGMNQKYCIWVRQKNEVGKLSWTKKFDVMLDVIGMPLMFTQTGKLAIISLFDGPVLVDLVSRKFMRMLKDPSSHGCAPFIESLVLLEGGNAFPSHT